MLDWWERPSRDAAVRAYIIRSRVRSTENLFIAKPYCPTLFRQGPPAGPHYLLEVMRGRLTRQQAVSKWNAEEKQIEKQKKENAQKAKWPFSMQLPCRHCSEEHPLTAFTTATKFDAIWANCLARGADLVCFPCIHKLGLSPVMFKRLIIFCDDCLKS